MNDYEIQKIRDISFCSGYNTSVSKYKRQNGELTDKVKELEAQIEKMKCLLNEIYSEYGFSELVKIRNNLPIEIQEVIKECRGDEEIPERIKIREDDGEWREPLVEIEE